MQIAILTITHLSHNLIVERCGKDWVALCKYLYIIIRTHVCHVISEKSKNWIYCMKYPGYNENVLHYKES